MGHLGSSGHGKSGFEFGRPVNPYFGGQKGGFAGKILINSLCGHLFDHLRQYEVPILHNIAQGIYTPRNLALNILPCTTCDNFDLFRVKFPKFAIGSVYFTSVDEL